MKLLYAFNQRRNRWYVIDDNTKEEISLKKKELIELYKNEGVHNIKVYGDEIKGLGYSLSRFTDSVPNGRAYVFRQMLKDGATKYYVVTTAKGEIMSLTEPELYKMARETGLVNIDTDKFREGHIKLLDNTYEINNVSTKSLQYKYDIEDYIKLYKRYKKFGFSFDKPKVGEYSAVFDVAFNLDAMKVESDFESFMKNHKIVVSLINSSNIISAQPIYENVTVGYSDGKYRYKAETVLGYLLTFTLYVDGQAYTREVIIDKTDKKLTSVIKNNCIIKFNSKGFKNLVTYDYVEKSNIDGFITKDELDKKAELSETCKEVIEISKSGQEVVFRLVNGAYVSLVGEDKQGELKLRNNIKINALEHKNLLNKLLK